MKVESQYVLIVNIFGFVFDKHKASNRVAYHLAQQLLANGATPSKRLKSARVAAARPSSCLGAHAPFALRLGRLVRLRDHGGQLGHRVHVPRVGGRDKRQMLLRLRTGLRAKQREARSGGVSSDHSPRRLSAA
eukprot:4533469-Pleurochrysis_carterae.AAC.1